MCISRRSFTDRLSHSSTILRLASTGFMKADGKGINRDAAYIAQSDRLLLSLQISSAANKQYDFGITWGTFGINRSFSEMNVTSPCEIAPDNALNVLVAPTSGVRKLIGQIQSLVKSALLPVDD